MRCKLRLLQLVLVSGLCRLSALRRSRYAQRVRRPERQSANPLTFPVKTVTLTLNLALYRVQMGPDRLHPLLLRLREQRQSDRGAQRFVSTPATGWC